MLSTSGAWIRSPRSPTGDDISSRHYCVFPSAPVGLTPDGLCQEACNGPLCLDLHGKGMADPRDICPSQQQERFKEKGVAERGEAVSEKGSNLCAMQDEPADNSLETHSVVNQVSNLMGTTKRDSGKKYQSLVEDGMDQNMGLDTNGPITKGEKNYSALKVYVRRKEAVAGLSMAQTNLDPNLHESRDEVKPRKLDFGDNFIDHRAGAVLHGSDTGTMTPKQVQLQHSPILSSSFNKVNMGAEEDVHWGLARDLGVSFAENKINMVKMMNEMDQRDKPSASAAVMGKEQNDS